MRIIAGVAKGRNLTTVASSTRPTSDRAREALFSSIQSEFGDFSNLYFLDLYSGTGAVALEALSRGFKFVHAVEKDDQACATIKNNFELVQRANPPGQFKLHPMSVSKYLSQAATLKFDVVFIDPPYETENADISEMVNLLVTNHYLNPDALVIVERATKSEEFFWPTPLKLSKTRDYGTATFYFATYDR